VRTAAVDARRGINASAVLDRPSTLVEDQWPRASPAQAALALGFGALFTAAVALMQVNKLLADASVPKDATDATKEKCLPEKEQCIPTSAQGYGQIEIAKTGENSV